MSKLSLCVVAKGGELSRVLTAAEGIVDEVVVVDSGEGDKESVSKFNVKYVEIAHNDDPAVSRNVSLDNATSDWILVLDEDEVVFKEDLRKLKSWLPKAEADAYLFETRNYTNDVNLTNWKASSIEGYEGYVPSHKIKLFKNDKRIRFGKNQDEVDAGVLKAFGGKLLFIDDVPVHHYGYVPIRLSEDVAEDDVKGLYELAISYMGSGELAKAMNTFIKVAKLDSSYKHVQRNLGTLYMKGGKADKALEHLQRGIEQRPNDAAGYNNLGVFFKQKQVWDQALYCFSKAAELQPEDPRPLRALAMVYKAKGDSEKGRELLEKAMKAFPGNGMLKETLDKF